ncbi:MAG: FAD-binding oxidoreductase, partial [Bauldia sp.]|nr:FAD-binding oxidoreductase [Bauldia sp.]
MEAAAPPERLAWQEAVVTRIVSQTGRVKSFFLKPPRWKGSMAGQHVDVRLSAPDGYQAQRSYSIGSAPEDPEVELVVERLDEGEVSPFFHEVVQVGDTVEMRGP